MAAVPSTGRASEVEPSAAAPEADATRALYERYAGQLYGFCLHRLGSREEAEDAVQTTFLNAFRGLRRGIVPEAEAAWLFKIAENVCLTRHRSAWRRGRVESPSDMQAIQDLTPARERDGDELIPLGDALAAMPETQRRAILLREWQGLSYKEIADEMDVSQSAVETLIFRARRSLANALETPWQERRASGRAAGRRAFDLGSLLAGLKTLFAGGTAAKIAVLAVAATGAAALAVAESRHSSPAFEPVAPSAGALRVPDPTESRRGPVTVIRESEPKASREAARERRGSRDARVSVASAKAGGGVLAPGPKEQAPTESQSQPRAPAPGTPASGAAEGDSEASGPTAAASVDSTTPPARTKPKLKPKQKAKPKRSTKTPARPKAAPVAEAKPKPAPKPKEPKAEQPKPEEAKPVAPAPPPPPPASPPSEKDKDKPDSG